MNELHLFAGAGGGILGGMLLGHSCVCAVEIEPYCRKVLLQRQRDGILPKFPIWDDVRTFDGKPWRGKVDIICGGFPCQDISCAGKGAGIEGERSGLWSEFARIVSEVRPRYVFVENSPMLALRGLGRVLGDLSESGYDAEWLVMGADDCGAPHRRKRMWILAHSRYGCGERNLRIKGERLCEQDAETFGVPDSDSIVRPSEISNTVADANSVRKLQSQGIVEKFGGRISHSGENMANSDNKRLQGTRTKIETTRAFGSRAWWDADPADEDGAFESQLGRVADGVANRVDRLKAIGNGQVPVVAATAFRLLKGNGDER